MSSDFFHKQVGLIQSDDGCDEEVCTILEVEVGSCDEIDSLFQYPFFTFPTVLIHIKADAKGEGFILDVADRIIAFFERWDVQLSHPFVFVQGEYRRLIPRGCSDEVIPTTAVIITPLYH